MVQLFLRYCQWLGVEGAWCNFFEILPGSGGGRGGGMVQKNFDIQDFF